MTDVDTTAADMLEDLDEDLNYARRQSCVFAEMKDPVRRKIERYELTRTINPDHFFPTLGDAVRSIPARDGATGDRRTPQMTTATDRNHVIEHMAARPSYVERAAAVLAIAALAGAIVLVVVGALSSWQGVVTTMIGLLVIVVAGWYVVVARRGLTRILAMCAVPFWRAPTWSSDFIVASMSTTRVISTFALVALSIGSARVALDRSARSLRRTALSRTPAPPARHRSSSSTRSRATEKQRQSSWSNDVTNVASTPSS